MTKDIVCSKCGETMRRVARRIDDKMVVTDYCDACGGEYFDKGELETLASAAENLGRKTSMSNDTTEAACKESIDKYADKFKPWAHEDYTVSELGNMVHFLMKKAVHRRQDMKAGITKDLENAQNYLNIIQAKLIGLKREFLP